MTYKASKKKTFFGEATTSRTVLSGCRSVFIRHTRLLFDVPRGELQSYSADLPRPRYAEVTTKTTSRRFNNALIIGNT